jgi:hypothetical protein
VQVTGLSGVVAVAAGYSHSLGVKSDGTVWAWGRNRYGQLGNGTNTDSNVPVQVTGLSGVVAVAGAAIIPSLLGVGGNNYGQWATGHHG